MTYIHRSKLYFGLLFLILSFQQCCSTVGPSVQCKIINFEYVECFWPPNIPTMNYTFSSEFLHNPSQDCPEYIMKHNYTEGCRIPLKDIGLKFKQFKITLSTDGNHTFSETFDSLERKVQLNPPYNLSVVWNEQDSTLLLHWNSSSPRSENCVVYMVRNQKDTSQVLNVTGTSYSLSQVSQNKPYVFQVRSTVANDCGDSDFWSDWSIPVEWGTGNSGQGGWQGFFGALSVFLLFLLGLLLCYCERKKLILLPVVPDPSKNLQDLFHKHDGNVESWVHISRELKEAFDPDYTEPSCDVCEVTPSCDADPTPVTSPAPQTDHCDEHTTEEERADEHSNEEERRDKQSTEEERGDEHRTEEERGDEHRTEEERGDEHRTEEERGDEHRTEEERGDEHRTEEERGDEHRTEEERGDEHRTEEERGDEHRTEEERGDEHRTEEERGDEHRTEEERGDEHRTEEERRDEHRTEEERGDEHSTEEKRAYEHSTEEKRAYEHSTEEERRDEQSTEEERGDEQSTEEERGDKQSIEEEHGDEESTEEAHGDEQSTKEQPTDEPSAEEQPAEEQSS